MSKKRHKKRKSMIRNAGVTATLSMALVLFLIGLLSLSLFMARDMADYVKENLKLSVVLKDSVPEQQTINLHNYLAYRPYAKDVEYISKEQALQEHIESLGEDPEEFLGFNPLHAVFEVKLNAAYADTDSVLNIEQELKGFASEIDSTHYQKDVITEVNKNIKNISFVLAGLALILMLISIVLINNTVRLRIYADRFLINTMKLVGAKGWFIRKPYVRRSIVNGILAAVLALALLGGIIYYLHYRFGVSTQFVTLQTGLIVSAVVIVLGILLSAVSSYFAVGRYIRMHGNDMYFV